jgi:hypothetical protein
MYNLLVQINAFGACAIQRIALIMVATKQKGTQTMTQVTANKIAQTYIEAGYSLAKALGALADTPTSIADTVKIINTMETMGAA